MNQHFILDSLVIYWGALGIATLFNQIMRKKYPAKVEPFFVDESDERTISIRQKASHTFLKLLTAFTLVFSYVLIFREQKELAQYVLYIAFFGSVLYLIIYKCYQHKM